MVGISMIAVAVLFAWATHHLLVSLNRYLASGDGPATSFRLWPQTAIWWFFPGFGAVAICWEITLKLWSAFGPGDTARSYSLWSDGRAGFDSTRICAGWRSSSRCQSESLRLWLCRCTRRSVPKDIRVCGYAWAGCKTFDYSKAVRMTLIEGFRDRSGEAPRSRRNYFGFPRRTKMVVCR